MLPDNGLAMQGTRPTSEIELMYTEVHPDYFELGMMRGQSLDNLWQAFSTVNGL